MRFLLAARRNGVERIVAGIAALMEAALPAYRPLIAGYEAEQLLRPGGLLYGFATDRAFAAAEYDIQLRRRHGLIFELLDAAAIADLAPVLGGRFRHGIYLPMAHHTPDPGEFTRALARAFVSGGGRIETTTVTGFDRDGDKVRAVRTTTGRQLAGEVVLAAGAWSRRLARELGARVPLDTERGYIVRLPDAGLRLPFPVISGDHRVRPANSTAPTILTPTCSGERARRPAKQERAERLSRAAAQVFPELRMKESRWQMSYRPSMPDSLPVTGRSPRYDNAYLAFGRGHKGLAQAAVTGRLIQQLADRVPASIDLTPYRPDRFWPARHRWPGAAGLHRA